MATNMESEYQVLVVRQNWTERHVARYVSRLLSHSLCSDRTFTLLDVEDIITKVTTWRDHLPRITPFYAVRCNNNPVVLEILAALGVCFSCSSMPETDLVLKAGVDADRIIFGQTAKPRTHLLHARQHRVDLLSFDADIELLKIKQFHPKAKLLIHIRCGPSESKFGCCPRTEAPELLRIAKELNLQVVGVSFHVRGGGMYRRGVQLSAQVFDVGFSLGFNMQILNIGGGMPGDAGTSISPVAREINSALNEYFPPDNEVEIIAEPGRYFVASAFTIVSNVHSARRPLCLVQEQGERETNPGIRALRARRASGSNVLGSGVQVRREIAEGLSSLRDDARSLNEVRQNLASLGGELLQELKGSMNLGTLKICHDARGPRGNDHVSGGNAVRISLNQDSIPVGTVAPSPRETDTEVIPPKRGNVPAEVRETASSSVEAEVIPPIREFIQEDAEVIPSKREVSTTFHPDRRQSADTVEGLIDSVENINIQQENPSQSEEIAEGNIVVSESSSANVTVIQLGGQAESQSSSEHVKNILFNENSGATPKGKKISAKGEKKQTIGHRVEVEKMHYYMDNGIYGSFSGIRSGRMAANPVPLEDLPGSPEACILWGPTCDGQDVVAREAQLPRLPLPSWLLFRSAGAYTSTTSTGFCGLPKPKDHAFATQSVWDILHQLPKIRERRCLQPTYAPLELPPPFSIFKPTLSCVHAKDLVPAFASSQPAPTPLQNSPMFQRVSPTSTVETHDQITMSHLSEALRSCLSPFSGSPSSVGSPNSILKLFPNHKIKMNSELLKKNVRFIQSPDSISSYSPADPGLSGDRPQSSTRVLKMPLHHNVNLNAFNNSLHANMSGYNPPFPDMSAFLTPSTSSNTPSTSTMEDVYSPLSSSPASSPPYTMDLTSFMTPPEEMLADSSDSPLVIRVQRAPTSPVRTMRIAPGQGGDEDDPDKSPTNPTFSPTRGSFSRT